MKPWDKIFKVLVLILGIAVVSFDVLLYNFCETQKMAITAIGEQQKQEVKDNGSRFKYQQDQVERLSKDLEDAQKQLTSHEDLINTQKDALADQKEALLQEVQKRQQVENDGKTIQSSLIDIKAQADAIKQDMKTWQKDYVAVLAQLEKKMDASQAETKSVEDNLVALNIPELKSNISSLKADIEKMAHAPEAIPTDALPPEKDKKIERLEMKS